MYAAGLWFALVVAFLSLGPAQAGLKPLVDDAALKQRHAERQAMFDTLKTELERVTLHDSDLVRGRESVELKDSSLQGRILRCLFIPTLSQRR